VSVRDLTKHFGAVTALAGVSLDIERGKVTALVGDNGAGKSTLVKVLAGVMTPDGGVIRVSGREAVFGSPAAAQRHGVHTLFQDLALADNLDVVENLFLGAEIKRRVAGVKVPLLARAAMNARAADLLSDIGITTIGSLSQRVESLSGGQRQTVAIARAVMEDASIVILDEPTAALGVQQAAQVQRTIEQLRAGGTGVLLISHNLREVFDVADRIAVMRLGRVAEVFDARDVDEAEVVAAIVGARQTRRGGNDGATHRPPPNRRVGQ
jgi:ABC-type sugar transport system ATPase subunit